MSILVRIFASLFLSILSAIADGDCLINLGSSQQEILQDQTSLLQTKKVVKLHGERADQKKTNIAVLIGRAPPKAWLQGLLKSNFAMGTYGTTFRVRCASKCEVSTQIQVSPMTKEEDACINRCIAAIYCEVYCQRADNRAEQKERLCNGPGGDEIRFEEGFQGYCDAPVSSTIQTSIAQCEDWCNAGDAPEEPDVHPASDPWADDDDDEDEEGPTPVENDAPLAEHAPVPEDAEPGVDEDEEEQSSSLPLENDDVPFVIMPGHFIDRYTDQLKTLMCKIGCPIQVRQSGDLSACDPNSGPDDANGAIRSLPRLKKVIEDIVKQSDPEDPVKVILSACKTAAGVKATAMPGRTCRRFDDMYQDGKVQISWQPLDCER